MKSEDVMYVDTAAYTSRDVMALAIVNRQGDCLDDGPGGRRGGGHCPGNDRVLQGQSYSKRVEFGHSKLRQGMHLTRGIPNSTIRLEDAVRRQNITHMGTGPLRIGRE